MSPWKYNSTVVLVGAAALTGLVAVAAGVLPRRLRRRDGTLRRVTPDGESWGLQVDGQTLESHFDTKREALREARALARAQAPSRLVIHRADGTVQRSHGYADE